MRRLGFKPVLHSLNGTKSGNAGSAMVPLYTARIEDLGPGNFGES
jgi:hypothetical protein